MLVDVLVVVVEVVTPAVAGIRVEVLDVAVLRKFLVRVGAVIQGEEGLFMRIIPVSSSDAGPDAIGAEVTAEVNSLACR